MWFRAAFSVVFVVSLAGCQAETFTSPGPTGVEILHGPPPQVSLGTELDTLLLVRVVDEGGHSLAGVAVSWQVIDGDGEIIPTDSISGVDGLASARWKFRMIPGLQRAQVKVAAQDPVTFSTEAQGFRAVQVTAGYHFGCGIDADAAAWCWGGDSLEIGNPTAPSFSLRPTPVSGGHAFIEVRAGDQSACGLTSLGEVWCWGHNAQGVLGSVGSADSGMPLQVMGIPPLRLVRLGADHGCGIGTDSTAWCWGNNSDGQSGGVGPVVAATQVATSIHFIDIAPGLQQTCGLTATGEVYCWGANGLGQLGDLGASRNMPTTPVTGGHTFVEIGAGDNNSCGRTAAGEVWCWGDDLIYDRILRSPTLFPFPQARSISLAFSYIAVGTFGGGVSFLPHHETLPAAISIQGVQQIAGRGSYCLISRFGDVFCSGSIIDLVSCSTVAPDGCAPPGPIPMPTGGRVYGYPPFGD